CNSQPWYFIVIDDEVLKNKVSEAAFSGIYSQNAFAKRACVLVIVLREKTSFFPAVAGYSQGIRYNAVDLGIACEHFVLQAQEDGVGTCMLGWFNQRAVEKTLGIPGNKKAGIIISMGYPQDPEIRPRARKSIEQMSRFNK
ncbi:NAD(P)H nitroreductase, partial [bacterium]